MTDVKELRVNNTTYDIKAKSVVNQNGGSIKFWTGTQAQYDAIPKETFYGWLQDYDRTTIIYTKVPYDTTVTPEVYDSNFELIDSGSETNYFLEDMVYYYIDEGEIGHRGIRHSQSDIIAQIDNSTIYICTNTGSVYLGTTLLNPIWG